MKILDVIIPAFNEEANIVSVVRTALTSPLVRRVLVVDDGSRDRTAEVAAEAGASVIRLPRNRGKAAALLAGAEQAATQFCLLLDGDLLGLEPRHLADLAQPVLAGDAAMTIGVFRYGRWLTDLSQRLTPFLNGQRVVHRDLLIGALRGSEDRRYAADTLISLYAHHLRAPVAKVILDGLTHVMKEEKLGAMRGFRARMRMFTQIVLALPVRWPLPRTAVKHLE